MGKNLSKQIKLEGDEKFMEGYKPGSGQISSQRWRKKHGFEGKLHTPDILKLQGNLKLEMLQTTNNKKGQDRKKEYVFSDAWLEQSKLRDNKRQQKKRNKEKKLQVALITLDEETAARPSAPPAPPPPPQIPVPAPALVPATDRQEARGGGVEPSRMLTRGSDPSLYPVKDLATAKVQWHPKNNTEQEEVEWQCPLVEVANPNRGPNNTGPETMLVYRPWTAEDRTAALKGIPPVEEGVPEFWTAILELQSSFHLNGREMYRCLRQLFTHKWGRVAGDFTGCSYEIPCTVTMTTNPYLAPVGAMTKNTMCGGSLWDGEFKPLSPHTCRTQPDKFFLFWRGDHVQI
ncbi:uncharacterized protein LOC125715510 isoform X8 [Brienomyrus brachyistius]|uniref:uncharacterized protein LOC125715510 isoform X8 n=1 Tax=Brienomyrus brachyistius TaxID=42636 RepID=UPI0020B27D24|nr:uncharacterized protein LOC125715510 isoform X8 [Brienomyrus brachyistius]